PAEKRECIHRLWHFIAGKLSRLSCFASENPFVFKRNHMKKPARTEQAFGIFMTMQFYCNRKVIGILNGTLTALPRCFPGVIFGSLLMMLSASFSRFLSGPRSLTLEILPSLSIVNITATLP